ncbi:MAG: hypothetical protein AVDCRST_MAG68-453 [uncultured Gemmatimonadetes bacterium]|uniref:Uncharacterized protein n=1 Tax=uncultured Gemmatimonadota bacterium TaxID=203437 RepID=A0A6J4KB67_9BACT|nr:MAG: hypothetical protein AVDCRST_MAG68-453 [uncultured Gemmatimonadota bacterium]
MSLTPQALQAIQSALDALEIDGLPTSLQAGEIVTPRLRPHPVQALKPLALAERILADITLPLNEIVIPLTLPTRIPVNLPVNVPLDLEANLNQIDLDTAGANAGDVSLDVVSKSVQFNEPALNGTELNTTADAVGKLPYLVPTAVSSLGVPAYSFDNNRVQGVLGKVTGLIRQITGLTGSIAGKVGGTLGGPTTVLSTIIEIPDVPKQLTIPRLAGTITTPKLLPNEPTVAVKWIVEDESGKALDGTRVAIKPSADVEAPSIIFLPEFTEMTGIGATASKRRVFCEVTLSLNLADPDDPPQVQTFTRKLGPFSIDIPKIPVPTVMAMIQHSLGDPAFPGGVLIAVPATSMIRGLDEVRSLLDPVRSTLGRLKTLAGLIGMATFGEAADYLDQVLALLDTADPKPPAFRKRDEVSSLNDVTMRPGGLLGFGRESFEDTISSVLLVGPPKRSVMVYRMRDFSDEIAHTDQGVFRLEVGPTAVAFVKTLNRARPIDRIPCFPQGSRFIELVAPSAPEARWNDKISSYRFLPL